MQVSFSDMALQTQETTPTPEPLTFDQPVGTLPIVDDARWSSSVTDNSLGALVVWILLLVVLQAAAWPLVQRVFRRFADGGWAFGRLTTLLLAGFLLWFPTALGITEFRAIWCWVALLAVVAACWWWSRRFPDYDVPRIESRRAAIIGAEIVFWFVFGLFLLFRFINPDSYEPIWGGEKAMEFAHINSILRSAHFPPVDPWYAGGYLNYYYYGSYLVAFLFKVTGIPSEIGFNLALPLFMALLATGMFSLGFTISRSVTRSAPIGLIIGTLATLFSVFIGNMVDAVRVMDAALNSGPRDLWDTWVWGATRIFSSNVTGKYGISEFPYFAGLYGDLHAHVIALPITVLLVGLVYALYLNHQQTSVEVDTWAGIAGIIRSALPHTLLIAIVIGSLFMTNAWDAPAYGVIAGLGVLAAFSGIRPLTRRLITSAAIIVIMGVIAYLSIIPFNNHYVALFSEVARVSEKTPLLPVEAHWGGFILILTAGFAVAGLARDRSRHWVLDPMLTLPVLGFALCLRWYSVDRGSSIQDFADYLTVIVVAAIWLAVTWTGIDDSADFQIPAWTMKILVIFGALAALGGLVAERPVFALFVAIGASSGIAWLGKAGRTERFLYSLVAVAALLGALLELVYLVDDLTPGPSYRMNTIFKFYNQIWTLFAIAAAGFIAHMIAAVLMNEADSHDSRTSVTDEAPNDRTEPASRIRVSWARVGLVLSAIVIVLGLAYPVQATGVRLDTRLPHPDSDLTLDAYAWMDYAEIELTDGRTLTYNDDLAAIDWFNEKVPGNPVIAEASFGTYRCNGSRFSIATGLPSVIGWERHEQQQRDRTLLPQRTIDIREIYEVADVSAKLELIEKYDIEYIIVGQTERVFPQIIKNECVAQEMDAGISTIESMVGSDLEVAFTQGTTTVYRVVR